MEGLEEHQWELIGPDPFHQSIEPKLEEAKYWPLYAKRVNSIRDKIVSSFLELNENDLSNNDSLKEIELLISFIDNEVSLIYKTKEPINKEKIERFDLPDSYKTPGYGTEDFHKNNPQHPKGHGDHFFRPGCWIILDVFYYDRKPYSHKDLNLSHKFLETIKSKSTSEFLKKLSLPDMLESLKIENEFLTDFYRILPSQSSAYSKFTNVIGRTKKISLTRDIRKNKLVLKEIKNCLIREPTSNTLTEVLKETFNKEYSIADFILLEKFLYCCKTIKGYNYVEYHSDFGTLQRKLIRD